MISKSVAEGYFMMAKHLSQNSNLLNSQMVDGCEGDQNKIIVKLLESVGMTDEEMNYWFTFFNDQAFALKREALKQLKTHNIKSVCTDKMEEAKKMSFEDGVRLLVDDTIYWEM